MIIEKTGNLFDTGCTSLVNPVNCVGVMGKGLALEFKKRFPDMYAHYKEVCSHHLLEPGTLYVYTDHDSGIKIINFPTKTHWKSKSQLEYIVQGLESFAGLYEYYNISSVAFPALGCGNGGLSWTEVKPVMVNILGNLPITIELYTPDGES